MLGLKPKCDSLERKRIYYLSLNPKLYRITARWENANSCSFYDMDVLLPAHLLKYFWPYGCTNLANMRFFE